MWYELYVISKTSLWGFREGVIFNIATMKKQMRYREVDMWPLCIPYSELEPHLVASEEVLFVSYITKIDYFCCNRIYK